MHRRRDLQQRDKGAEQKPSSLHQTSEIPGNGVLGLKTWRNGRDGEFHSKRVLKI